MGLGDCKQLMLVLKNEYNLPTFVETGTWKGDTSVWAAQHFPQVFTIEFANHIYESTSSTYSHIKNIEFLWGHTTEQLKLVVPQLNEPALFWLDAHWMGGGTAGENDECPLLEELEIINNSECEHFILIDDARLFLSPPPSPHRIEQWPSLNEIMATLSAKTSRYTVIFEDAIVSVPERAKSVLAQFCQDANTKAWEEFLRTGELRVATALPKHPEEKKETEKIINTTFESSGESKVIARFIKANNVVFDVGANAGDWTAEVVSQGNELEIHLFEPIPHVYKKLSQNIDKKVISNNLAVGQAEEVKTFYYYEANPLLSTFYRRFEVEKEGWLNPPKEIPVLTTTIDNYCQRHGIKRINFLKIDVGGGELDVLYGVKHFLETGRIDYLQFEYGGTYLDSKITLKEAFEYLQKFRYSIFKILPDRLEYKPTFLPEYENFEFSNFLAVNERFHSNVLGEVTDGKLNIQELCRQYSIEPRGVIHVGAHEGTEITAYQQMGAQKVLFVEANPAVFERLQANLTGMPDVRSVNCAISNQNGTINLHVTSFDQSSSILQLKHHQEIYPHITETHQITVQSKTLDTLLKEQELNPSDFNILNIDIQGAELLALQGATNWLKSVELINTEVNYEELYEGCALIDQLDEFLEGHGFQRAATTTPIHPSWGDAIYVKKPAITSSVLGMENMGRLGNQIFLYAFLRTYAREHNLRVETPAWIGQYLFGHNDAPISQPLPLVGEQAQPYKLSESAILNAPEPLKNVDFQGYFQFHTQYHAQHKEYFQSLFQPVPEVEAKLIEALNRLRSKGKTVVGLHLRRGDYRSVHTVLPYLTVAPSGWYKEWLDGLWETLDEPVLFIASDEIETVVSNFAEYAPITVKDLGVEMPEAPFYPDFYILSQCDVLATSNSTFSFAAAMLNERCKFFFRPNLLTQKMIAFDPWNSEPLLRDNPNDLPATVSQKPIRILNIQEVALISPEDPELLWGCSIDSPTIRTYATASNILIGGWVIGKKSPAVKVELICDGEAIRDIIVNQHRPDVAAVFPGVPLAENSGYATEWEITGTLPECEISIQAVLADETRVKFGVVRWQETIYQTPSNNERAKCELSVGAIMKDEAPYLIEWLEFHKIVGVERFYLYNNNSADNTIDILQPYVQSGEVILHHWPVTPGQISAYEHCLSAYKTESEWIAFIDLDEFIFPSEKDDLKEVLNEFDGVAGVGVNELFFGSSGHEFRPEGLQIEHFTKRSADNFDRNKYVKSIVRPKQIIRPSCPHFFIPISKDTFSVTENMEVLSSSIAEKTSVQKLRINHYYTRSQEEMKLKLIRGWACGVENPRTWRHFEYHDRNEVEDLTIQRFVPKLRQAVDAAISKSRIAQILMEQWRSQSKLYQMQIKLEESQTEFERTQEKLALSEAQLHQTQEQLKQSNDLLHKLDVDLQRIPGASEQNLGGFEQFITKLQQVPEELQPIKEELELSQIQYHKTQEELAQTKSQLVEREAKLQEMESFATPLNQLAELYLAQGKLEDAIALCEQVLKIQPKFAPAYKTLGNALQAQGKLDEAKTWYLRALEIQPDFAPALANLGTINAQQQHWQEAIASYQKAIAIQPNFAGVYRNLAKVFSQIGKPDEAVECCYAAVILEPETTAEEYFNLGNTLLQQGKQERAIVCYRRAVYLNPNLSEAHDKLSEVMSGLFHSI
ncbi:FkbM family methyltransferase [Microcoleus sp. MON1_C5]|uniref:FkbM family methyltransferase n=1 Tax=Microcoleus sp. MON1_C5 TaxID=2818828 RepID=UPI002FD79182